MIYNASLLRFSNQILPSYQPCTLSSITPFVGQGPPVVEMKGHVAPRVQTFLFSAETCYIS